MFVSSECVAVMSGAVLSAAAMSVLSFSLEAAMGVLSPSSSCSVFVSSDCVAVMSGRGECCCYGREFRICKRGIPIRIIVI